MKCRYCQQRIPVFRLWKDRRFCSDEHRRRAVTKSARALRDNPDIDEYEEVWLDYASPVRQKAAKQQSASASAVSVLLLATAALVVLNFLGGGSTGGGPIRNQGTPVTFWEGFQARLSNFALGAPRFRLNEEFNAGLRNWQVAHNTRSTGDRDWSFENGLAHPGRLRIWRDSLRLADYNFQFDGQIERKAIGWAFRATDAQNYYASKLVLASGPDTRAEILRFAMVKGKETVRATLPVPVGIEPSTFYRISIHVKGRRFVTTLDNQVIDSWEDGQLRNGGVGFFNDKGELAAVRSVAVTDSDGFLDRVQSLLSFGLVIPAF